MILDRLGSCLSVWRLVGWIGRKWFAAEVRAPRCEVVDFSKMNDREIREFYATNFPGRFSREEIERGIGRKIDWSDA